MNSLGATLNIFSILLLLNATTLARAHVFHKDLTDGGQWILVRRVKRGNFWHPAADQLRGTDVYGTYVNNPTADATFSKAFDIHRVTDFAFATGDGMKWLVASKESVLGGFGLGAFYNNELRPIKLSSKSPSAYSARWYRRPGHLEDPWISLTDHGAAIPAGDILYGEHSIGLTHAVAVLPHHNGANVYVRYAPIFHQNILGGGWNLVRRVRAGNAWHPATDQLLGDAVYGSYVNDPTVDATFSKAFDINRVADFAFATGDGQKWLVASKESVVGAFYANEHRQIKASSKKLSAYSARWYRRQVHREDPWISLTDHATNADDMLYGGNSCSVAHTRVLPLHNGANVWVRYKSTWHPEILGGGWTLVRRVKAGNTWHPATDQLVGTDVYGTYTNNPIAHATFSIAFDINHVDEFLFATGDGTKWLVASKDSVIGAFYANQLRTITASSVHRHGQYSARWYRRQAYLGYREDPWISLSDHATAAMVGDILYGGNSNGHYAAAVLPHHKGANVFVRYKPGLRRNLSVERLLAHEDVLFQESE